MRRKLQKNIVERCPRNPLITLRDLDFRCSDVHNAGAAKHNGQYVLLITVESLEGICAVYRARSEDGRDFQVDNQPILSPATEGPFAEYEAEGVRDARITPLDGLFYITYLATSRHGFRLGLARTEDFSTIERVALISEPDTKSGALFPRTIGGRCARLERPREGGNIWISYSDDLLCWGDWQVVMTPRHGYWDHDRIGVGAPPIEVDCGWLLIYYGVREYPGNPLFRLGAAILDRDDPTEVIGCANVPILSPRETYERIGDVGNLVFTCGAVLSEDGSQVEIYYGAADSCICLGTVSVEDLQVGCIARKAKEG